MQTLLDLPRIELAVDRSLGTSGASFWTGTEWRLVARANEHPNRQRFSLMHEFKHVIDHPYRDLLYATEAERERIADHFAACVLMRKIALTRAWCAGLQDNHDLARQFAVSPQAMRRRLSELGLGQPRVSGTYACSRGLRTGTRFAIAGTAAVPGGSS
jgi:Zn-dependent peptidase ImmA (M78 family)